MVLEVYFGAFLKYSQLFFKKSLFYVEHFFKVIIELVTILFLLHVFIFWLQDVWDLISPARDQACTPCPGR